MLLERNAIESKAFFAVQKLKKRLTFTKMKMEPLSRSCFKEEAHDSY